MPTLPFRISRHATGLTALACSAALLSACDNRSETAVDSANDNLRVEPATTGDSQSPAAYASASAGDSARTTALASPESDARSTGETAEVGEGELLTIERMMPEQIFANSDNRFALKATNDSDKVLHNVVLHHAMMGDFEVIRTSGSNPAPSAQGEGGSSMSSQSFDIGVLMPGDSREVTIDGRPGAEGELHSCVWADYSAAECAPITVVAPQITMEHLFVDAEGRPVDRAYLCDEVFVMHRLKNVGTGESGPIQLREKLPQGLIAEGGTDQLALDVESLGAGETFESEPVKLDLERAQLSESGGMQVFGRATGSGDRLGELSGTSPLMLMKPEIAMELRSPGEQYFGRDVTVEAVVKNVSDVPAKNVTVLIPVPEGARQVSLHDSSLTIEDGAIHINELAAGESRTVGLTFTPGVPGDYSGQVVANAYCAARVEKTLALSVIGIPALQVETIDTQDPVEVGSETTYRVRLINEGNAVDTNVKVTGSLPEGFVFVSASEGVTNDGQDLAFPLKRELAAGEELYFEITARAEEAGRVSFRLKVTSDNLADAEETEPTTAF